jgi:hypothetical protein
MHQIKKGWIWQTIPFAHEKGMKKGAACDATPV